MNEMVEDVNNVRDGCPGCPYIEFGARVHTKIKVLPIEGS
jgi:hypothetical protein